MIRIVKSKEHLTVANLVGSYMLNYLSTSKISDYLSPDKTLKPDEDRDYLSGIGMHNSRQGGNGRNDMLNGNSEGGKRKIFRNFVQTDNQHGNV